MQAGISSVALIPYLEIRQGFEIEQVMHAWLRKYRRSGLSRTPTKVEMTADVSVNCEVEMFATYSFEHE